MKVQHKFVKVITIIPTKEESNPNLRPPFLQTELALPINIL